MVKTDERFGMNRLGLMKIWDHKRKVASLLKYHYVSVEILAKCCMGKNPLNKAKVCNEHPIRPPARPEERSTAAARPHAGSSAPWPRAVLHAPACCRTVGMGPCKGLEITCHVILGHIESDLQAASAHPGRLMPSLFDVVFLGGQIAAAIPLETILDNILECKLKNDGSVDDEVTAMVMCAGCPFCIFHPHHPDPCHRLEIL